MIIVPDEWSCDDMEAELKRVGVSEKYFDNQVDVRPSTFDEGWLNYVTKQIAEIQKNTQDDGYGMSAACKKASQVYYGQLKNHIRDLVRNQSK